jgi:hypothetical protein
MNVLHQYTLVLKNVTLGFQVQSVVQVTINLAGCTVLAQETTQDALTAHPDDLRRHACIGSTATLTGTGVTTLAFSGKTLTRAESGLANIWLANNQTILDQFTNVLTRIGIANL